ncbi:MAG: hypothetical protein IID32_06875 [Planctomycetes bacterium]|nr:hypothetical protein [Planctomycetota bacterium]
MNHTDKPTRAVTPVVFLFASVVVLAFICTSGKLSWDSAVKLKVTESIVEHGDFQARISPDEIGYYDTFLTEDGQRFTRYWGIGQSVIFIPSYFVARELLGLASDHLVRSFVSFTVYPVTLGLIAVVFFLLLREFGFAQKTCFIFSFLLIFSTGLWALAEESADGIHVALTLLITAWTLRRYQLTGTLKYLIGSAFALMFTFLIRSDTLPSVLCFMGLTLYFIHQHRTKHQKRTWMPHLLYGGILLIAPAIEVAYNLYRFGHPVVSYSREYSFSQLITGLNGLLFSPGKSIFIYNPVILLAIPGFVLLWRQHRSWAVTVLLGFSGCLLLHSAIENFHGNYSWGPRYLSIYLPFLMLAVIFYVTHPQSKIPVVKRTLVIFLMGCSLLVQVAANSLDHQREFGQMIQATGGLDDSREPSLVFAGMKKKDWTMFEPEAFFLKHRLKNIAISIDEMLNDKIAPWPTASQENPSIETTLAHPVLHYLSYWPYHLTYYLPAVKLGWKVPLWVSTLIILMGVAISMMLLITGYRLCAAGEERTYILLK